MDSVDTYSAATSLGDRIIEVNHAGEHGAISIYSGQIFMARITARDLLDQHEEFRSKVRRFINP